MPAADSLMPLISNQFFGVRGDWMAFLILFQFAAFALPSAVGMILYLVMERRPSAAARTFSGVEEAPYIEFPSLRKHSEVDHDHTDIRRAA